MKVHCIGTGSSGNCYIVEYEPQKAFMLDCGLPSEKIKQYIQSHNLMNCIQFCLISHLHVDHLHDQNFLNDYSVPVYFPKLKKDNKIQPLIHINLVNYCGMYQDKAFYPEEVKNIKIEPFKVAHDDIPTFGYKITLPDGKKIVYQTDFGTTIDLPIRPDKIDLWMIECNYDKITIEKDRSVVGIRSKKDVGHCSNEDCFEYLSNQIKIADSVVLLLHKSNERFDDSKGYKIFNNLDCKYWSPIKPWSCLDLSHLPQQKTY